MGASPEYLTFIEDTGVTRLLRRLRKGMRIKSRIVLVLDNKRYLLRIQGRNLLMESNLSFERKEELWIEVLAVRPRLKLRLLKKDGAGQGRGTTNFIV